MKKIIILLCTALMMCFMSGCNLSEEDLTEMLGKEQICGGVVDNSNANASKDIKSDKLVSFSAKFYLYGTITGGKDSGYEISVNKDNEGKYILKVSGNNAVCETDEAFLREVQSIIVENNLISINGMNKHTSGLPVMFQPCYFDAVYASGEELHFSIDNNPESDWGRDLYKLTRKEFEKHGLTAFAPPADNGKITKFILKYTEGDICYHYGEITVSTGSAPKSLAEIAEGGYGEDESEIKIQCREWNRVTNDHPTNLFKPGEDYYEGLKKLISEVSLEDYADALGAPYNFNYKDTPDYYEYYIEYENGKTKTGFSDVSDRCEAFAPVAKKFADYINSYANSGDN